MSAATGRPTGLGHAPGRRLWSAMSSGDARAGRALVNEQLDQGVARSALILDLLAPAQLAVGLSWQRGQWTVADEHAATAVVDAALAVIEASAPCPPSGAAHLVSSCAESEWHVLPARLATQLLREGGADVCFLGPSMPADHLREYLARLQPDALILSATMPTSLPGAARSIEAAHDAGVPVIAGGSAFGPDMALAARLGADGWLADVRTYATSSAQGLAPTPPLPLAWRAFLALEHDAPTAARAAYVTLLARTPALQQLTAQQAATAREDLGQILAFLAVTRLVGEEAVMHAFTAWLLEVLSSRGDPRAAVAESYQALADAVDQESGHLLRRLAEAMST